MLRGRISLLVIAAGLALAGRPAGATWSVVLADELTGEVAVGSATCVAGVDLVELLPVVVVEKGAAAAQSLVDTSGVNRQTIRDGMRDRLTLREILTQLSGQDALHQSRQYGMSDTRGDALSFTGASAGAFAGERTGQVGTLHYAVQGNLLTGQPVLDQIEQVIANAGSDVPLTLMRAMLAGYATGGDGRCSCSPFDPTGCGSPPPEFDKAADVGFMIVARAGDQDGGCNGNTGCATGDYYLNLNVAFQGAGDPDPVVQLRSQFIQWRQALSGRPDHHRSKLNLNPPTLPADGTSVSVATVILRDFRGQRVADGGATVTVSLAPASTATLDVGPVTDLGKGVYRVPLRAGTAAGTAVLDVLVDDGAGAVQLAPRPVLELIP